MQQLKDNYFFDLEISNHNILVVGGPPNSYDFCLINQILPLQYRVEYGAFLSSIYEEDEYELYETVLVKKVIFLLVALAIGDGVQDFAAVKTML